MKKKFKKIWFIVKEYIKKRYRILNTLNILIGNKKILIDIWKTKFIELIHPDMHPLMTMFYNNDRFIDFVNNPHFIWYLSKKSKDNFYPENSSIKNEKKDEIVKRENFTQILRTYSKISSISICNLSKRQLKKLLFSLLEEKLVDHFFDIEKYIWFGEKEEGIDKENNFPLRKMDGIISMIDNKIEIPILTKKVFNDFLRDGFKYGSSTKVLFVDSNVLLSLEDIGIINSKDSKETIFGFKGWQYVSIFGLVNIIHNPIFNVIENRYKNLMVLLDMSAVKYIYLNNSNTFLSTNIQSPETDGRIDGFLTECAVKLLDLEKHLIGYYN